MNRTIRRLVCCFCLLVGLAAPARADEYTFAVVPQFEQRKLFAIWKPIIDRLAQRTGLQLRLVATLTVPEFEQELAAGHFDFVYANPYQILREASRQGYLPLVRDGEPLRGIVVVPKASPLVSVRQLDGKVMAVPSPNALGASLLIRAELERGHGVHVGMLNAKTHSSVYLHVANGLAECGGGVEKTLQEQPREVRDALRIIYTTADAPSHPIAAHPRLPEAVRQEMRQALLDLAATDEGARLLAEVPMAKPVVASMADYRPMAALNLDSFWVDTGK